MEADRLADRAALLADRTRAGICLALLDGRAWTAGELAAAMGVARSTASEHLTRLVDGGLLRERRQGRHRYLELAGPQASRLLEDLVASTGPATPRVGSLTDSSRHRALARGRTCYDHLAGALGVAIADGMRSRRLLEEDLALTTQGRAWLTTELGADLTGVRRPVTRACLDWTERRPHLAGAAGAHVCAHALEHGWVRRIGTGRAVRVTDHGAAALDDLLGIGAVVHG